MPKKPFRGSMDVRERRLKKSLEDPAPKEIPVELTSNRQGPRHVTGVKNQGSYDIRRIRRIVLETFYRIGGVDLLDEWALAHFDQFLKEVLLPLLPKEVDSEGLEISRNGSACGALTFDREKYKQYLKDTGGKTVGRPKGDSENIAGSA